MRKKRSLYFRRSFIADMVKWKKKSAFARHEMNFKKWYSPGNVIPIDFLEEFSLKSVCCFSQIWPRWSRCPKVNRTASKMIISFIMNVSKLLIISPKSPILDVWWGSQYISAFDLNLINLKKWIFTCLVQVFVIY